MPEEIQDGAAIRGALAVPEPNEKENHLIQVRPAFSVTDLPSANWVVTKVKQARDYVTAVKAWGKSEIAKGQDAESYFLNSYGPELKALVEDTTRGTDKKSLNVPCGRIQLRKRPLSLEIVDETALKEWAKANYLKGVVRHGIVQTISFWLHPELCDEARFEIENWAAKYGVKLESDISIDKKKLADHFKATGDIPDGCELRGGEGELYIQ